EEKNRPTPVAIVISHHPAFYLGSLNVSPFGVDDYAKVGAIMGTPLRLTPSETLGEDFMVPADAEMVIEGHVLPNVKEVEGPFGEFTGYYGPQRMRNVIEVSAITHRSDAIFQHIFTGHRDTWVLGGIPKEGSLFNLIRGWSRQLKPFTSRCPAPAALTATSPLTRKSMEKPNRRPWPRWAAATSSNM